MTASLKSDFLRTLTARGFIHQMTDESGLDAALNKGVVSGYIGFDATADSLHVGSMVQIMALRRLQQAGHRPIVLMGGGTTKVGDPSDKTGLRQMMTDEQIDANIASIKQIFTRFLRFDDSPTGAIIVNNNDWLGQLDYITFLREIGRHFTINKMIGIEFVKRRLEEEQPMTFLEFNYMIMQGYDFAELAKRHNCLLQMGGREQWGNIVQGVELGRRLHEKEIYGLTTPLITTASGVKMGKTVAGAVWLKAEKLSPYDYWQFWRNTEDADVGRFLRLFTDLPLDDIARLEALPGAEINEAKKILAHEATRLCHGEDAAAKAAATAATAFSGGSAEDLPTFTIKPGETALIVDIAVALGMAASKGEAKRLIEQGGVKLNDEPVSGISASLSAADLTNGSARLTFGKKRHALVKIAS